MIHWYRKSREYSKLTKKNTRSWPENGRENTQCDATGGKKQETKLTKISKTTTQHNFPEKTKQI